jgi:hypothetical protein
LDGWQRHASKHANQQKRMRGSGEGKEFTLGYANFGVIPKIKNKVDGVCRNCGVRTKGQGMMKILIKELFKLFPNK